MTRDPGSTGSARSDRFFPLLLALPLLGLELATLGEYGYFRDELYYLASTVHLDWGYVDHPPFSIAVLAVIRALFGESLPALRIVPALLGAATVVLVAHLARRLGGGRAAQAIAALTFSFSAVASMFHFYSMNAWDIFFWVVSYHLLISALEAEEAAGAGEGGGGARRRWLALGVVLGLGLLNKISVLWLGAGLFVGLLATRRRAVLARGGPYLAAAVAFACFLPHLAWQVAHGWPTLEFMRNATGKLVAVDLGGFLGNQLFVLNPAQAPFWIAGLAALFLLPALRPWRLFGWSWLTVFLILFLGGGSRPVYLLPAYPPLLAGAGILVERLARRRPWRWLAPAAVVYLLLGGVVLAPIAVPLLPPATFVSYATTLGMMHPPQEKLELAELPQFFADQFGWQEIAATAAEVYHALPPAERQGARVFGGNYGEAGAIDVLGRRLGLPPAMSGHNSYWLWGPGEWDGEVLIILGGDREDYLGLFEQVERVATVQSDWALPHEARLPVYVARRLRLPVAEAWQRVKMFV